MTKRILVCVALAVGCLAQIGLALPDLVITQLDLSPTTPTSGSLVTIVATIENTSRSSNAGPFFVRFSMDAHEIDLIPLSSLGSGRTKKLTTTWTATAGPHILLVEVDGPLDRVEETDELNNSQSVHVDVRLDEEAMALLSPLKIAVARFDEAGNTGFVNVGQGVADKLAERFTASGLRVVDRVELDALMQENGLNPTVPSDVATAGRLIGADLLILGSVVNVNVQDSSLNLGFLRLDSASVDVALSAQVLDVYSSLPLAFASAEGHHEGTTGFSIDLGQLLSFLTAGASEICSGGLQVDRAWHNPGQTVLIGYRNAGGAGWFGVEIYSSTGAFLKWLGWQYVDTDSCGTWSWDQRTAASVSTGPGIYTAKLWNGTSHIDSAGFQIRPGISLSTPGAEEVTAGSQQFDTTAVGKAMNHAVGQLTSALLLSLEDAASQTLDREAPLGPAAGMMMESQVGQIAAILPDGRLTINLGASSGTTEGDVFEVLEVENLVLDAETSAIVSYDIVSTKGKVRITEVREQVSYATMIDSFAPAIGDVIRSIR